MSSIYQSNYIYKTAGMYCGIATSDDSLVSLINYGRIFEKIWLLATAEGYSVQPVMGVFLFNSSAKLNQNLYSKSETKLLIQAVEELKIICNFDQSTKVICLFRIGKSKFGRVVNYKKSLKV